MPVTTYGRAHRWFAWRPVDTDDRGWRWLRVVTRRRVWLNVDGYPAMRTWAYWVEV